MDAVAVTMDMQYLCLLLEQALRDDERKQVAALNQEIHETAAKCRRCLTEPEDWPRHAERMCLDAIEATFDIQAACAQLYRAVQEDRILLAALNKRIHGMARRLQEQLNDPGRFEKGESDGNKTG